MIVTLALRDVRNPAANVEDVNTVVVRDNHGNPIMVALQQTENTVWTATKSDADFESVIERLGLTARLVE